MCLPGPGTRRWIGHAELGELGVARFALTLRYERKEFTLNRRYPAVLGRVY
ncbi:hypothetical protein [Nonomuraea sp. LPB2021202275-12-8]|uniref:hypothetical protein n=1 Tax=Nonomuraea sp. LPB2021202275-12-8 TaxID=3120159 RepID=UPI00300DB6C4